jgi:hypothetical protein
VRGRRTSLAVRFRWLAVLGLTCAVLGVGLYIGLGRQPAVLTAAKTAPAPHASLTGPSVLSQPARAPGSGHRHHPTAKPATPARTPPPTRRPAATPLAAPPPAPALAPAPTAEYQTPTGNNERAWSEAILKALGDPLTSANIVSMGYWMQNEAGHPPYGIVGANNPINVSEPGYGGTPIKDEGNGYHLYSYPTVPDGISALVAYLNPYGYPRILAALKAGQGLSSPSLSSEFSTYSGGGYSTVPDAWGSSQGRPLT